MCKPDFYIAYVGLTLCYALLGREDEARVSADNALRINPKLSFAEWANKYPYKNKEDTERLLEALRKLGLE